MKRPGSDAAKRLVIRRQICRMAPLVFGLIFVLLAPVVCAGDVTQEGEKTPPDAPPTAGSEVPEAPQKVDVQPVARDDQIARRLQEILDATEWFTSPSVEVNNGVVFLTGEAAQAEFRRWATELAQNTQDVVAVVNRMTVRQRPLLDLSPAMTEVREFLAAAIQSLPLLGLGLIVLLAAWWIALGVRAMAEWGLQRRIGNPLLRGVVTKVLMLPVLLSGVYLVLRMSGLTQLALTVLGGTGIAGLVVGIAFRDIAENFLASILISLRSPFRLGDQIQVEQYHGYVQRLSTRGTLLMTLDGNHVMIPNSVIYKSVVTNFTANPNRRLEFTIGIGYDDSVARVQELIRQILDEHPVVLQDPEPRVVVQELGAATVNLRVYLWVDASRTNPDAARSSVMRAVKRTLLREGISMPDEAREVVFANELPVRVIRNRSGSDNATAGEPATGFDREHDSDGQNRQPGPPSRASQDLPASDEPTYSEAEVMRSDAEEIQQQAAQSWEPDEGANLLAEEGQNQTTDPTNQ